MLSTTYIYKIVPASSPTTSAPTSTLPATASLLTPSQLDRDSKYIHMSTAAQVPGTLAAFFASPATQLDAIYLLRVPLAPLEDAGVVKWEAPDAAIGGERFGEGMFAHLYFESGRLGLMEKEVEGVREVASKEGEKGWGKGLEAVEGWLV